MATPRAWRRRSIGVVASGLALSLVAACGGGGGSAAPDEPLQFFLSGDANQGGGIAALAAQYEQETGVKVEIVDIANDDLPHQAEERGAGERPAGARAGRRARPGLAGRHRRPQEHPDGSKIRTDLAAIDEDGKVLSLPTDITAVGLFINKSLFDEAGVGYPTSDDDIWSWDEFVAQVKQVQQKTGTTYGMVMDRSSHRLKAFLYEFGSDYFQPDASGSSSTNANTKAALEYFNELNDDSFMPRSVWLTQGRPATPCSRAATWSPTSRAPGRSPTSPRTSPTSSGPRSTCRSSRCGPPTTATRPRRWSSRAPARRRRRTTSSSGCTSRRTTRKLSRDVGFLPAVDGLDDRLRLERRRVRDLQRGDRRPRRRSSVEIKQHGARRTRRQGMATEGDPLRDETVKYLNGEQDVDTDDREHQRAADRGARRRLAVTRDEHDRSIDGCDSRRACKCLDRTAQRREVPDASARRLDATRSPRCSSSRSR